MNLMALDFWGIVWAFLGLIAFGLAYRFVRLLARLSDGLIGFLTHLGLKETAKLLLIILVDYDQHTYSKSRFILWSQVPFRFALLWTAAIGTVGLLCILKMGRSIHSVGIPLVFIILAYLGYRCLKHWARPRRENPALNSFSQEVKEQPGRSYSMIRRWDYLDELFAQSH
jgi:hypothetical protein